MNKIKLFCFPYAGGSANVYKSWQNIIDKNIELIPVELAGRGKRIMDEQYNSIQDAAFDIYNIIEKQLYGNYAFFGHSMGSLIAFELAHIIKKNHKTQPLNIFFSGKNSPNVKIKDDKIYHKLSKKDFINKLIDMGGTPDEVINSEELMELFLPLLRNDFRINELYNFTPGRVLLDSDFTVFGGLRDREVLLEDLADWKIFTSKKISYHYFDCEHFFIHSLEEEVTKNINNILSLY